MMVFLGAEFYPPAEPPAPEPVAAAEPEEEEEEPQPYVEGQPTIFEPNPPPAKPKRGAVDSSPHDQTNRTGYRRDRQGGGGRPRGRKKPGNG